MYGGGFVQGGVVRGGFVQGGFVRRGFCPTFLYNTERVLGMIAVSSINVLSISVYLLESN